MPSTGPAALDALFERPLDLALLAANLPEMDALEVTNLYRFGSVGRQRLPILGLIGEVSGPKLSAWIEAGLDGCIGKPIEPSELLDAVNAYLDATEVPQRPLSVSPKSGGDGQARRRYRACCAISKSSAARASSTSVIAQFVADASRLLPELAASAAAKDTRIFRDHMHALRSCAGNVGAVGLYKLCLASQAMAPRELIGEGSDYVARLEDRIRTRRVRARRTRMARSAPLLALIGPR